MVTAADGTTANVDVARFAFLYSSCDFFMYKEAPVDFYPPIKLILLLFLFLFKKLSLKIFNNERLVTS